jgi:hypothetical protein
VKESDYGRSVFVFMYENRTMKPFEIILRSEEGWMMQKARWCEPN